MYTGSGGICVMAATAVSLLASGGPSLSAQQARADQTPAFRSGIEVVSVDVGVVDRQGLPLRGLTPADFVVTVGGQPRNVVTAEFVDRTATVQAAPSRPEAASISTNEGGGVGRLFAFIVDQNTLELGSGRRVATAAGPFLSQLTFNDRSALMLMPVGPTVAFTWAHDRVREGLQRITGSGRPMMGWEYGSLADARDITNRNLIALRGIGERECGTQSAGSSFGGSAPGPGSGVATPPAGPTTPPSGGTTPGEETGGTTPAPAAAPPTSGGSGTPRGGGSGGAFGMNSCTRDIQMQAESAWRTAQMNSLASLSALRQFLSTIGRVRGDKTVILISGGWPLDEREELSVISTVATDAAAARATIFTIFVPASGFSADRRMMTSTPLADNYLHSGPLETLAAMTGGGSFRAEVGAEGVFERLGRELSGYYRIGIEKDPSDGDGKGRRMKVQVPRSGLTVRAREIFDVRTYEDRDWAARMGSAIDGPVPATEVGLRVTNYLSSDPEDPSRLRMLISGEVTRVARGEATLRLVVSDLQGKRVTGGESSLPHGTEATMPFSTNVAVPPGSYIVRVAVMDSAGRVGSVDHRVEARQLPLGALSATGPVLVRVPASAIGDARLALDTVSQDERLALEINLEGDKGRLETTDVAFEIAATADGPALLRTAAAISPGSHGGSILAQGVADMRVLPPGAYVVRARVNSGTESLGDMHRAFAVIGTPRIVAGAGNAPTTVGARTAAARPSARLPIVAAPPFALDQVLSRPVLGTFLDRVAARPDASSPGMRALLDRARKGLDGLDVSDAQAAESPVAAFLKGLTLLAQNKLDPAADQFRNAIRASTSADFYPAMVYLGACFAAGGKDKEAAGAWRTALIREGDAVALHVMLADAFLRQGRGDLAVEDLATARVRWPEDQGLKRRFAAAAMLAGPQTDGLKALDELIDTKADDEALLAIALLTLYEAFESREPIESVDQDRTRMLRFADAYRARGGASTALINTWVAAATRK